MKIINNISFFVVVVMLAFFSFAPISKAMTEISFENNNQNIQAGNTFKIDLKISSLDKIVNVADGTILYDKNKLEIKKVETTNSIFNLWTEQPIFDNKIGTLSFIGGASSGFKDINGQILSITFLAKKTGVTTIGFQDIFSVYASDGLGTQINPWLKPLSFTINKNPTLLFIRYILLLLVFLFVIIKLFIKYKKRKNEK